MVADYGPKSPVPGQATAEQTALSAFQFDMSAGPVKTLRIMMSKGLDLEFATQLIAIGFGLPIKSASGKEIQWKIREITHLLALAHAYENNRLKR